MDLIGIVIVGDDTYRVLGRTWLGCTIIGTALNLGAHLWEGGRVSAVGTEGTGSVSVTLGDGTELTSTSTTYTIGDNAVVMRGAMTATGEPSESTSIEFHMSIRYTRADREQRSYTELQAYAPRTKK
ncbi:hypothetical protein WKY82_00365 [Gordonia malaquae]|uniref:hypothetical protein n=1 Tax=Gordonia malaquae TaxID=410332 RepID=UPI0030C79C70